MLSLHFRPKGYLKSVLRDMYENDTGIEELEREIDEHGSNPNSNKNGKKAKDNSSVSSNAKIKQESVKQEDTKTNSNGDKSEIIKEEGKTEINARKNEEDTGVAFRRQKNKKKGITFTAHKSRRVYNFYEGAEGGMW